MDASEGNFPQGCDASAWAEHPVTPYGAHPRTEFMKINGQRACVVWPDVELGPHADAMLIVAYPHPIKIVTPVDQPARVKQIEEMYGELMVIGTKDHIVPIAKTLRFQVSK